MNERRCRTSLFKSERAFFPRSDNKRFSVQEEKQSEESIIRQSSKSSSRPPISMLVILELEYRWREVSNAEESAENPTETGLCAATVETSKDKSLEAPANIKSLPCTSRARRAAHSLKSDRALSPSSICELDETDPPNPTSP